MKKVFEAVKNNFAVFLTLLAVVLAASGFTFATRRKRQSISKHMNQIDDTYSEYKMKAKRCEAELYRLKDIIDEELKGGKLEDTSYQLLMNRIEGYMVDVQKQIVNGRNCSFITCYQSGHVLTKVFALFVCGEHRLKPRHLLFDYPGKAHYR